MAKTPKAAKSANRVKKRKPSRKRKSANTVQLTIPTEILPHIAAIAGWVIQAVRPAMAGLPDPNPEPVSCCETTCANVPDGKKHLVICDGKTMKALAGTVDGQKAVWDNTAKTWVLSVL